MNDYIEIGHICNTFGLKGELKVTTESDFIDYRFRVGAKVFIKFGPKYLGKKITSKRIIKGNVCITLDGLNDINLVEQFVGADIYSLKSDVPPLNDGEYLIDDLVGKEIILENGTLFGTLSDVIIVPSNKILEIQKVDGSMYLLPFIKEYVLNISDKITIKTYEVENA